MDEKELRVGNWMRTTKTRSHRQSDEADEDSGYEVIEFKWELGDFYNWLEYALDDDWCEPIPITPGWLDKFEGWSFNGNRYAYEIERKWDSPQLRIKCYLPEVYDTEGVLVGVEEYGEGFVRLSHIKYIHQIMNLYYALTGEELKIKTD